MTCWQFCLELSTIHTHVFPGRRTSSWVNQFLCQLQTIASISKLCSSTDFLYTVCLQMNKNRWHAWHDLLLWCDVDVTKVLLIKKWARRRRKSDFRKQGATCSGPCFYRVSLRSCVQPTARFDSTDDYADPWTIGDGKYALLSRAAVATPFAKVASGSATSWWREAVSDGSKTLAKAARCTCIYIIISSE